MFGTHKDTHHIFHLLHCLLQKLVITESGSNAATLNLFNSNYICISQKRSAIQQQVYFKQRAMFTKASDVMSIQKTVNTEERCLGVPVLGSSLMARKEKGGSSWSMPHKDLVLVYLWYCLSIKIQNNNTIFTLTYKKHSHHSIYIFSFPPRC